MITTDSHSRNGGAIAKATCAVLFCTFAFCWIYFFQADVLAVAQHVLSSGQTTYKPLIEAVLITLSLQLLQLLVMAVCRLHRRTHALTYLPSMLALAVVSDISTDIDRHFSLGAWPWVVPLVLLLWGATVWTARQMMPYGHDKEPAGLFSRRVWTNGLLMVLMMLAVALVGNTNAVFHYQAHIERALSEGNTAEALRTGDRSLETSADLTMLRALALSKEGLLGERLFRYPVAGRGADLLPLAGSKTRLMLLSPDTLWRHLGARPSAPTTTARYLSAMMRDTLATHAVADYVLCGCLIDRDIDAFARLLPQFYTVDDSLPRHYREALTLYTHLRAHPVVVYRNTVADEDWADLQQLERRYTDHNERLGKMAERYAGSYWYYFYKMRNER